MSSIPPKPTGEGARDEFKRPVSWLVGRDLIAALKLIALFAAFKGKLDPRDWMTPRFYPSHVKAPGRVTEFWRGRDEKGWAWKTENDAFWRDHGELRRGVKDGEFWFDYIADSGDGQLATYNVAYLCLSDLWLEGGAGVGFGPGASREALLPRGQFLVVGGDTAYHIADYTSLSERFQTPFRWAFASLRHDLHAAGRLAAKPDAEGRFPVEFGGRVVRGDSEPARPIFGVPGNHDYYDILDGFNRQFRRPSAGARRLPNRPPQLSLLGFRREQDASYVAVQLPFGWWFWALDTEISKLDARQLAFFAGLNGGRVPDKLILATPEPAVVFRRRKSDEKEHALQAFAQLGLAQPPAEDGARGRCRLDLSGDVHHYARYFGPDAQGPPAEARPSSEHYASVVAGGGGAFYDPSETHVEGPEAIEEQVIFPPADRSRAEVAPRLFDLRNIWHGGYVWLFGMILTAIVYFAADVPQTSAGFVRWLFLRPDGSPRALLWLWRLPYTKDEPLPGFALSRAVTVNLGDFLWQTFLLLAAFGCLGAAAWLFGRVITRLSEDETALPGAAPPPGAAPAAVAAPVAEEGEEEEDVDGAEAPVPADLPVRYRQLWLIILLVLTGLGLYAAGVWKFAARAGGLHPFGLSLLVAYHLLLAGGLVVLGVQNSSWLAHRSKFHVGTEKRYLPVWVLNILGAAAALFGVWMFGTYEARYVLSDIIFALVVVGILTGLTLVGTFIGGALQGAWGKALLTLAGLWHAVLQLVVPLWLVRLGDWRAVALALPVVLVFSGLSVPFTRVSVPGIGARLLRWRTRAGRLVLFGAWLLYGAILLALPFLYHDARGALAGGYSSYLPRGAVGWVGQQFGAGAPWALFAASLATALALGFLLSMSWLSWYFGVALSFQGHNNEVGGASRLESFKHIVRIRLTRDTLTAYVIGFDEPEVEAADLKLKLVDQFQLRVTP